MPYVDFEPLQHLKPAAFKLYVYFLHRAEATRTSTLHMPLADLGFSSGLLATSRWAPPALRHGNDGPVRTALAELVEKGFIEKTGRRGRRPNTYHIVTKPDASERFK